MFPSQFVKNLQKINSSKTIREEIADFLKSKNHAIDEILLLADHNKEIRAKSLRAVEVVAREHPQLLFPYTDKLLEMAKKVKFDDEVRPLSKIFEVLVTYFFKNEKIQLSDHQLQQITQSCFDWFITNQKTAVKAQCMSSLYLMGNKIKWIHGELKPLIEQNIATETAGYQARARMILKKMR